LVLIFFEKSNNSSHGLQPANLIILMIGNRDLMSIHAPETSMAKCCFRNPVTVDIREKQLKDRSGLDKLIERGLIKLPDYKLYFNQ
jgi:hypothetical protein